MVRRNYFTTPRKRSTSNSLISMNDCAFILWSIVLFRRANSNERQGSRRIGVASTRSYYLGHVRVGKCIVILMQARITFELLRCRFATSMNIPNSFPLNNRKVAYSCLKLSFPLTWECIRIYNIHTYTYMHTCIHVWTGWLQDRSIFSYNKFLIKNESTLPLFCISI